MKNITNFNNKITILQIESENLENLICLGFIY